MVSNAAPRRAEAPRDHLDRYLLPVEGNAKRVAHSRATTIAGTIADRFNIEQWSQRMVAKGLAERPDLLLLAKSTPVEDRKTLNGVVRDAKKAASSDAKANVGTALHSLTEALDLGEPVDAPAPYDRDVAAYKEALVAAGITTHPWWIERILYHPELGIAGTADRLLYCEGYDLPIIGDLKTGSLYSFDEIAQQMALYARATHWYDPDTDQWGEMPEIDRDRAIVIHLPAGEGRCELHEVNVAAGWEGVELSLSVRAWRKRKDLAKPFVPRVGS